MVEDVHMDNETDALCMADNSSEPTTATATIQVLVGIPLLIQQFGALFKKNIILSLRNKKAFIGQLFSPVVFILLLVGVENVLNSGYMSNRTIDVRDPEPLVIPPIPPCETKFYVQLPCYDFAWSGNASPRIQSIVEKIMLNNPGRPIPSNKVKSFKTSDDVNAWLYSEPLHCAAAFHFVERSATVISYGIQTNDSETILRGVTEDPVFKFQLPLQIAADREIARVLAITPKLNWNAELKEFAHPSTEYVSAMASAGWVFLLAITMFPFISQIGSLVAERELKLRQVLRYALIQALKVLECNTFFSDSFILCETQFFPTYSLLQAMSIMGLYESAYWLSWLVWDTVMICIASLLTIIVGLISRFDFFVQNSFVVTFLTFFLFQLSMIGFAFAVSTLLSKSSAANTVGFFVFIVGSLTGTAPSEVVDQFSKIFRILWNFFPPNIFGQEVTKLNTASMTGNGIAWSGINKCPLPGVPCSTMGVSLKWNLANFIVWFLLALYLDNVIPNSSGVRKSVIYFVNPGYWTGSSAGGSTSDIPLLDEKNLDKDEDVLEEERTVRDQLKEDYKMSNDSKIAVQIRGLAKAYPGRTGTYHAVKGVWMNFEKDQLFCLLGPNGAGKTTTINCLIGNIPVTGGDALIYGNSVRSSIGMTNIRRIIGVCPQFDILWPDISCEEHLRLFGSIKGLPPSLLDSIVKEALENVKLAGAAGVRAGSCSGGMKRRLSVAGALLGDPKLVILDEPTTGMDPVTRRHVWDVIEYAKKGRAIVLTTHSMEEADILGDRIAIVAKGKLRCIGTSIRLKSRFGTGLVATVSFVENTSRRLPVDGDAVTDEPHHLAVKQFFKHHLNVVLKEENKSFLTFVIPRDKEKLLSDFFDKLEDQKNEFGIGDIQLGLTTLEEVFLNIAKKAEFENAPNEGNLVTLTLTSGKKLRIPKGANYVGIPKTESEENPRGVLVEVIWEQDENGFLKMSGHSKEYPVPPNAKIVASNAKPSEAPQVDQPEVGVIYDLTDSEASNLRSLSRKIL
ncbi:ABC transporter A family member 11-like [Papaver somniferum]|uniref:ABC transporter A family member 11-like n=1 Tax=Papaver somniferum TaxID=3469 RepID=UPI000E702E2D|nr:ABC transporter A family member 11-like [Papaver somniferum]